MNDSYLNTVRLLLQIAPYVFDAPHFAMKGGTVLNLFLHNLPRLSVDIDVTFTDHQLARTAALEAINSNLAAAKASIEKLSHRVQFRAIAGGEKIKGDEVKLTVTSDDANVIYMLETICIENSIFYTRCRLRTPIDFTDAKRFAEQEGIIALRI